MKWVTMIMKIRDPRRTWRSSSNRRRTVVGWS